MSGVARVLLMAGATWGGSLVLSLLLLGITAAATQKLTSGKMQPVVAILVGMIVLIFVAGIVFVHSNAKRILAGDGSPWFYTVLYSAGAMITILITGFITLVVLNR